MSYNEISNSEKIEILKNHVRNFEFSKYNLEVEVLAEQGTDSPDPIIIAQLQSQISNIDDKTQALEGEISRINAL